MKGVYLDSQFLAETKPSNHINYLKELKKFELEKVVPDMSSDIVIPVIVKNQEVFYTKNLKKL